jgi:hypothetical protein
MMAWCWRFDGWRFARCFPGFSEESYISVKLRGVVGLPPLKRSRASEALSARISKRCSRDTADSRNNRRRPADTDNTRDRRNK